MPHKDILRRRVCQRKYYAKHKEYRERKCAYTREWLVKNKDKRKFQKLKARHNLEPNDYNLLFDKQEGKCAICGKHQLELKKALHVDHCHRTGCIRGLLCSNCNFAIGLLKDDIENLRCAILYLNKFQLTSK